MSLFCPLRAPLPSAPAPRLLLRARASAPAFFGPPFLRHGSRKAGALGVKTKSAIKKRFRVSGGGTIRRLQGGKRHLSLHKSSARIRRLGARVEIKAKGILRR
jgi:ribosomal protein L35